MPDPYRYPSDAELSARWDQLLEDLRRYIVDHPSREDVRAAMRWREDQHREVFAVGSKRCEEADIYVRCGECGDMTRGDPDASLESTGMCIPCSKEFEEEADHA